MRGSNVPEQDVWQNNSVNVDTGEPGEMEY